MNRRIADNHEGWIVQFYSTSANQWKRLGPVYPRDTRQEAVTMLLEFRRLWPRVELRIYEQVKGME